MGVEQQPGGTGEEAKPNAGGERVEFRFDEQFKGSLESGLGALQQVFAGFAKMAQNVAGTEVVRNLTAGTWLGSVADCLEAIASSGTVSGAQAGELACHVERLSEELAGSKFAGQAASISSRLNAAVAVIESASKSDGRIAAADLQSVATTAGYFRAAAKSVISVSAAGPAESK